MKRMTVWAIPLLVLIVSGCTLKGTFKETTDTTSNITGTTSGRTWFNEDGLLNPEHKLTAFATFNQENVEQDLARGQGEYVTSLGTLLGLQNDQQAAFLAKAQGAFQTLMTSDQQARLQQLRMLAH
ncbi:MAG: DUF3015 family protein [Nitrospiraceae bacterium]